MAKIDEKYNELSRLILNEGRRYEDPNRKGVYRIQIPKYNFVYDLKDGFPAITTKKLYWKGIVGELLWFLRGDTNIKYLIDNGINIWNKDAYNWNLKNTDSKALKNNIITKESLKKFLDRSIFNKDSIKHNWGNLGRIYGAQWRNWRGSVDDHKGFEDRFEIDQISNLIRNLKEKPLSTEHIVTAWNPAELDDMALPPCHFGFQIMVYPLSVSEQKLFKKDSSDKGWTISKDRPKYGFDLVWSQRSVDTFLGLPFNIASYALLAHIIGKMVNMVPGKIHGDLRNVHFYENSIESIMIQLERDVNKYGKCELLIDPVAENKLIYHKLDSALEKVDIWQFQLKNYKSHPTLPVEMLNRD